MFWLESQNKSSKSSITHTQRSQVVQKVKRNVRMSLRRCHGSLLQKCSILYLVNFSFAFPSLFPRFSLAFPSLFPKPLFSRLNSLCMHASNLSFRLSLSLYLTHSVGVCQRFFICHTFRKKQNSNIKSFSVCLLLSTRAVGLDSLHPRFITQKIIIKNSVCVCGSFGTAKGR